MCELIIVWTESRWLRAFRRVSAGVYALGMHTKATMWIGLITLVFNIVVAVVLTPRLSRGPRGVDATREEHYLLADAPEARVPVHAAPGRAAYSAPRSISSQRLV